MSSSIVSVLLWAAALSSGLMAGVYLAFSGFIMRAFNCLSAAQAISAMNVINTSIVRSVFMPLFFGSTVISVCLVVLAIIYWGEKGAGLMFVAGVVYFIGMFMCTVLCNVPLNNFLATLNVDTDNLQQAWSQYLTTWTSWNHLRVISSLVTCLSCIWLLSA